MGRRAVGIRLMTTVLAALAWTLVMPAGGQAGTANTSEVVRSAMPPLGEVLREIDDPHSGDCWLLFRDPSHPGGPGRLVLAPQQASSWRGSAEGHPRSMQRMPVIRAGDALIVEEHTAVVDARLAAVAVSAAASGGELRARLKIGGKVVRVVALSPGLAVFAPDSEAKP